VTIVGAGPTGALLAILLKRRGFEVIVYDSRPDPRIGPGESGRSINLALADRGIHALQSAGVFESIAGELLAMRGRMIHQRDGTRSLQPYGQRPSEVIYSISRERLNRALLNVATDECGIEVRFQHRLERLDAAGGTAYLRDVGEPRAGGYLSVALQPLLAADGAGSVARRELAAAGLIAAREDALEHGYKELTIPAGAHGDFVMEPDALHVWPRGDFMLIALPNTDRSFTATIFMPKRGEVSFDALRAPAAIERFLRAQFPDACGWMPNGVAEFRDRPTGFLGTVYAERWNHGGRAALIGDAAHAIVPFHGQGMNCCFEDCIEFDACVAHEATWEAAFERFFAQRKPNTDAIAAMALENYHEMRERVAEPAFHLQQALALELERRHPQRFIPRYSMVMFHHEIPYRVAYERGAIQTRLLADLTVRAATLADIDYARAAFDIERELPPIRAYAPA
jgi:kynurenine 3-monooxygenase